MYGMTEIIVVSAVLLAATPILLAPLALALLYIVAIQFERGGAWRVLLPVYVVTLLLDVLLNFTTFALLMWDFPQRREYTFSQRLQRLVSDAGWRGRLARVIAAYLNFFDPTPPHVRIP